ncbi:MAG: maleylpyruvate isomerase family mycothiol-dependent enzyme [Microthrixaceae bacterium]|nr:maleylpyruvate isomerase family mycothiol-dependent enzyme [Microthrixaceae bacterium]
MHDRRGHLEYHSTVGALRGELDRTIELAGRTPADRAIPTCPGWSAADLLEHLGTVHRWAAAMIEARATEPISRRNLDVDAPTDDDWAPWISAGAHRLLVALESTHPDESVWTWGGGHDARWWARRQLHETAVHDADLALALGEAYELDEFVAADGICELLDNAAARLTWPDATPSLLDATVHLHATDADTDTGEPLLGDDGEWMVTMTDGAVSYTHGHGKG